MVGLAGVVITDGGANLLRYEAGLDRFTAVAIATLAAVAISFVASRYWTFRHREHGGLGRETVLFCVANGIGVAISEGCVWLASAFGWEGKLSYNIALAGGIALATLFRYWSYKKWVWPRSRSVVAEQARERSLVDAGHLVRAGPVHPGKRGERCLSGALNLILKDLTQGEIGRG